MRNQIKKVIKIKGIIPATSKLSLKKNFITNRTSPIFITKLKRPKVKILKGREITFKKGLTKKLAIPIKIPARRSSLKVPEKLTSGIYLTAIKMANIPERREKKSLSIILNDSKKGFLSQA